jgi:hypothetical protein
MIECKNQTLDKFGFDQTGLIEYHFNQQGFRSQCDYNFQPKQVFFGCSSVFGIGVSHDQIFSSYFPQSHNYGLAGKDYTDHDTDQLIEKFVNSDWYHSDLPCVVVWKVNSELAQRWIRNNFWHFFCTTPLTLKNCYPMIPNQDQDVSATHAGSLTHKLIGKVICQCLGQ